MSKNNRQHVGKPGFKWIRRMSRLLDSQFTIPSTSIKFGLDPLFSIFPGLGDLGTYAVSLAIIYTVYRNGASGNVVIKMLINSSIDAIVGSIPILGTLFDVWYKSNMKNLRLLQEYYEEGKHQGSGKGLLALVIFVVVVIIAVLCYLGWLVLVELAELLF
ncbi:DUF4112 domain-containing protein [Marivirga sp. S37H4]|uniref:DUF4112 domain-containing protein n=1 Tax=Marivirga aurantiaca TaxID=2802615 RepID=A0A934X040_9BACT|nr:DUF4112 domain-containing protein [Marivirga aurantiaca]MBK6265980.1 DUF4112 domain-containing protein [Marivirga aurantiaca]